MRALIAFAAVFMTTALVPGIAFSQTPVDDVVKGLLGGGGATGGGATPAAGVPPEYTPPLHGDNPHGQGDVATVDILPSNDLPQPGTLEDTSEDVIVGQSRGEEDGNGNYRGRVVLLHENLLGLVSISVESDEQNPTNSGPLSPLQEEVLDEICNEAPPELQVCLEILTMNSTTTNTSSFNEFSLASADIVTPLIALNTGLAQSSGNISEDANCQTARGSSNVADPAVTVGPGPEPTITAAVLQSSSESRACNDPTQNRQENDSTVLALQENGVPVPEGGCADGTPDTNFDPLTPALAVVCNADDSNGVQASAPYGVREALGVFLLISESDLPALRQAANSTPLVKVVTAAAESHAVAPGPGPRPPGTTPQQPRDDDRDRRDRRGPGQGPGGPAAAAAQRGGGELAFTGASLLVLALIGGGLTLGGVALARASARSDRRATV